MKKFDNNVISDKFLAIDIETTNLDPNAPTAGIIEVYAGILTKGILTTKVSELYSHPNSVDTEEFHKITREMLKTKPSFEKADKDELISLLKECCNPKSTLTLMAYYTPFEYQWLSKFLGLDFTHLRVCDPWNICRILYPDRSHKLLDCAKDFCGIVPETGWAFHRAADDVKAMTKIYQELLLDISIDDLTDYDYNSYCYDVNSYIHE